MKRKNLKKKIRRLEKRLRQGTKKLARLRQKLKAAEAKRESAARAGAARQTAKSSSPIEKKDLAKTHGANGNKAKRRPRLSPERRAQLAATMKARWAAKKAAEMNPGTASADEDSTLPESRHDGAG